MRRKNGVTLYNGGVIICLFLLFIAWVIDMKNYPPKNPKSYWPSYPKTYVSPRPYTPPKKTRYKCIHCNGRGLVKCFICNGRGGEYVWRFGELQWDECISCDGTGLQTCQLCQGLGYKEY